MSLLSNAKWNGFSQLFKVFVQVVNLVYLAKIIPPEQYGILAMAAVIVNLGVLLRDLGTSSAIIQKKVLNDRLKNTVFWLNVVLGFSVLVIILLLSPLVSSYYHQPEVMPVLMLLSLTFPLSSCAAVHLALMERESKFRVVSSIEVSSSLLSVIVAIVLANLGFGVYSLVAQAIVQNLSSAILFWFFSKWYPSFKFFINKEDLFSILGFSTNVSLFNIINYLSRNADSFIIGKFMSAFILGSYNLAYRIMLFPLQSLTFVVSRSLYPLMSHYQDDENKVQDMYLNSVFVIVLITSPLMSGIAFYAKPIVYIIFGSKWYLTASVLVWLAPTAIIQSVLSTTGSVFMAKNRTDILLKLGILGAFLQVGAFIIGSHYSIVAFSKFYLIANVINFFPAMICLLSLLNVSFFSFFKVMLPVLISTLLMVLMLFVLNYYFLPVSEITNFVRLFFCSLVGVVSYILSLYFLSSRFRFFIKSKLIVK
ncbi:polysaccharide biosynthesis protein [Tatumella morbirosei]|uniref:Polysaccharide biosynthesis protein n=1 Tax=Tatumella morbirosei TaxID=642227 RepID=A0A095UKL2_9GAMM|nr:lipopolysaccharide biosynthesis protein [Tatumella morbirosei]KGD74983.2 polysaccharide biosynthesis protein [Tatumella morbirosei]